MGDEEPDGSGRQRPSLELPRLSLRRRRGRQVAASEEPSGGGFGSVSVDESEPNPPPPRPIEPHPQARRPGGTAAAIAVGLVVGLGIVGLTWASLRGCEQVQGTSSCGRAGYPLLGAILVVMVVAGTVLLRLARVPEPGSTSFLAVGLASVLALLLLVDHLTDASMIAVIPLLTAACYAAARWVTGTFVDQPDR